MRLISAGYRPRHDWAYRYDTFRRPARIMLRTAGLRALVLGSAGIVFLRHQRTIRRLSMRLHRQILFTVAALQVALFVTPSAHAISLSNRVFVSQRSGNDANACNNILTPCQTFAGAVLQLNPGGEAIVLDSGGYAI